jgi:hypothetical protein
MLGTEVTSAVILCSCGNGDGLFRSFTTNRPVIQPFGDYREVRYSPEEVYLSTEERTYVVIQVTYLNCRLIDLSSRWISEDLGQ